VSYCIIIRGPLGVGKTTVARALSAQLSGLYISIDQVLEDHNLLQSDGEGIAVSCFLAANEMLLPAAQAALDTGRPVIIDGCFYHLEPITDLEQRLAAPVLVFTLQAPLSVCVARDKQRSVAYGVDAAAAVHSMVARVAYGTSIDTMDQTLGQTVASVANQLPPAQ